MDYSRFAETFLSQKHNRLYMKICLGKLPPLPPLHGISQAPYFMITLQCIWFFCVEALGTARTFFNHETCCHILKEEENDEVNGPYRKRVHEEIEGNNAETANENNETTKNESCEETKYGSFEESDNVVNKSRLAVSKKRKQTLDILAACPVRQTPGHTGYLTFAVLYP